jgi:hypothetical protein
MIFAKTISTGTKKPDKMRKKIGAMLQGMAVYFNERLS